MASAVQVSRDRIRILGAPVDVVDAQMALDVIDVHIGRNGAPGCVLAVNPEKVRLLASDGLLRGVFERALLLVPDGIGVVLGARILYGRRMRRVAGADLMEAICAASPQKGYRLFIFGSEEQVNRTAVDVLRRRYPGINIVGRANGFAGAGRNGELIRDINESRADILFVGLGSPRQERWMHENLPKLNVRICQGIGGTLDTIAGTVKRAPRWARKIGCEWLYRLVRQPTRCMRQVRLLQFAFAILMAKFGPHRTPLKT